MQRWWRRQREWQKSNRLRQAKKTTLHVHHAFLYISLPSLHHYNSRFLEDGNKRQQLSFSFPELWCSPLEFNSKKIANNWRIKRDGISAIKFRANSLFKWRFRSSRRRPCVNSLFLPHSEHVHYRFSPYNYHVRKKKHWKWTFEEVSRKENSTADGL